MKKMMFRWIVMCCLFSLLFACSDNDNSSGGADEDIDVPEITRLEDYDPNSLIDPANSIKMLVNGLLEKDITVSDTLTRTVKIYIPEACDLGSYFVVLTVPDGEDTATWLVKSGWIALAEEKELCLYVMEPDGEWGTAEEEAAYIAAAYSNIAGGNYYLTFPTYYLVGYGEPGKALQKYAMTTGITVAGAVFIDASSIDPSYLETMASTNYSNATYSIAYPDVPVPVWIISKSFDTNTEEVISYWKTANDCEDTEYGFNDGIICFQDENSTNMFTPQSVSYVATLEKKVDYNDPDLATMLYEDFLSNTTRYGGNAGGNTLAARPDYESLGVEFKTMTVDGYKREYLVYVPEDLRESEEAAPVVFALHGMSQTYKMMFDISQWWKVADARGFILVMPTSTVTPSIIWNTAGSDSLADDFGFIEALIAQIDNDYNVDVTKRYLTGQSMGCMMSHSLAMTIPEYFAAIGATSGPIMDAYIPTPTSTEEIPFYIMVGEYDFWVVDIAADSASPFRSTLEYWLDINSAGDIDAPSGYYVNDRYLNYSWNNAEGIPMVRYTITEGRGHSFLPEEMWTLWDEWFSHWHQDGEGNNVYMND